ncbi:hypothetical protein GCM10022421_31030 [Oceanisphaera sediminis]|uniref:Uncharacterized protein n=1 Tax=Oceanisphaera sediminis TaxID=981381 RepID=A0ABP7EM13_9GAMM
MNEKPWLSTLSFIGFYVNSAIANGHADKISFEEIYDGIERGTLLDDLSEKIPGEFDFSLFKSGEEQSVGFHNVMSEVAGGLQGRERRKVGIETSGLHLLMAFILEAMQHQLWVKPN